MTLDGASGAPEAIDPDALRALLGTAPGRIADARARIANVEDRLDVIADRLERIARGLRALAESVDREINVPLGADVTDVMDRPDFAERVAAAGDDAEVLGNG